MTAGDAPRNTVAPEPEFRPSPASDTADRTPRSASPHGHALLALQQTAGNHAVSRLVQRDPGSGGGAVSSFRGFVEMPVSTDVVAIVDELPELLHLISTLRPDDVAASEGVPAEVANPHVVIVWTVDKLVRLTGSGVPVLIEDSPGPPLTANRTIMLGEAGTGRLWRVGTVHGRIAARASDLRAAALQGVERGVSQVIIALPAVRMADDPVAIPAIEARIAAAAEMRRRAAGPPGWASGANERLRRRLRHRAEAAGGAEGGDAAGTGAGTQGTGRGGGGTSTSGSGVGEEGTGTGAGTTGEGRGPDGGRPLQGPVRTSVTVRRDGQPILSITKDRARTTIPMRENESDDELERRVDRAIEDLQQSRDPSRITGVSGGAGETGFQPGASAEVGGQTRPREGGSEQGRRTTGVDHPEERVPGDADVANAPPYPSEITTAVWQRPPDPPPDQGAPIAADVRAPTTVLGATNAFSMVLDYAAQARDWRDETFLRLGRVRYTWELIDVSGLTMERARARQSETNLGRGERQDVGRAEGRDIVRSFEQMADDQARDIEQMQDDDWPWEARAAYLGVIGISNTVRAVGSLIASYFSIVSTPQHERRIGFDREGEFLVRCVATPVVTDEQKANPDRYVIRASSVAVLPIRVMTLGRRATESVEQEQRQGESLEHAVESAESPEARELAEARLEAHRRGADMSGFGAFTSTVEGLRRQLDVAQRLQRRRAEGPPDARWGADLLQLDVVLLSRNYHLDRYLHEIRSQLIAAGGRGADEGRGEHERWVGQQARSFRQRDGAAVEFRPRVVLASEENGQVTPVMCMLGELASSTDERPRWRLVDVSSPGGRDYYSGSSDTAGAPGHAAAIRDAFRNFAENNGYGRGLIAIRLPSQLTEQYGSSITVDRQMVSAPGARGRALQRLRDLATVAEIAGLFVGGPAALALGAVGGIAGVAGGVDALMRRHRAGTLLRPDTLFDVFSVVGGVAALGGVGAGVARLHVADLVNAGQRVPSWIQRLETTEHVVRVYGVIDGAQQVFSVTHSLSEEMQAAAAGNLSEGERRAATSLALARALRSGAITVRSFGQSITEEAAPRMRPGDRPGAGGEGGGSVPFDGLASAAQRHADGQAPALRPADEGAPAPTARRTAPEPVTEADGPGESGPRPSDDGGTRIATTDDYVRMAVETAAARRAAVDRTRQAAAEQARAATSDAPTAATGESPRPEPSDQRRRSPRADDGGTRIVTIDDLAEVSLGRRPVRDVSEGIDTLARRTRGDGETDRGGSNADIARDVLRAAGDLGAVRREVASITNLGEAQLGQVVREVQTARQRITDDSVGRTLGDLQRQERFADLAFVVQDHGTVGFASDRDITIRVEPRDPSAYATLGDAERQAMDRRMIQASAEAVPLLYDALEQAGFPANRALDTNFYTELHESRIRAVDRAEAIGIAADQQVVSLTEVLLNTTPTQWRSYVDGQLARIDADQQSPTDMRGDMRRRFLDQVSQAESTASRLLGDDASTAGPDQRNAALASARERLVAALDADPPPPARDIRRLMAEVKLLEPDAYGTRPAVESVVLGSQAMRRASLRDVMDDGFRTDRQIRRGDGTPGPSRVDPETGRMVEVSAERELARRRGEAGRHVGHRRAGDEGASTYQVAAARLAAAEAVYGHLVGHLPDPTIASHADASTAAKNLLRVVDEAETAGVRRSQAGAVARLPEIVAGKQQPGPEATQRAVDAWARTREIAAWASDAGVPLTNGAERLAAFISWARVHGDQLVGTLRQRAESAAWAEGVEVGGLDVRTPTAAAAGP
jgi:hypothetical protein